MPLPFRRMEMSPGEEVQVDYGHGAWVIDPDGTRPMAGRRVAPSEVCHPAAHTDVWEPPAMGQVPRAASQWLGGASIRPSRCICTSTMAARARGWTSSSPWPPGRRWGLFPWRSERPG
jgi:hypothetical protein